MFLSAVQVAVVSLTASSTTTVCMPEMQPPPAADHSGQVAVPKAKKRVKKVRTREWPLGMFWHNSLQQPPVSMISRQGYSCVALTAKEGPREACSQRLQSLYCCSTQCHPIHLVSSQHAGRTAAQQPLQLQELS